MPFDTDPSNALCLGIDTGGTYTDAVLWSQAQGLVAKAKALTSRHDLAVGIGEAVDRVLQAASAEPTQIRLVSMSTTLATNALVEGQGGSAALVMIGFSEADLEREGLRAALGPDPVIFLPGGHDVHGRETPLDMALLEERLAELKTRVAAVAVCGYFAVRNPSHENKVRDLIRAATGLPVTTSHELSAKLGGPRRALTTLLNARLISMIDRLIGSMSSYMDHRGIDAPLMVVRGDGALVSAQFARMRPIETILSGPAASLVGARHLTGLDDAIVSDIGGTTTDIAVLAGGRPKLDPDGATVGGMRTMVEAVAMRTHGLGGDSEVRIEEGRLEAGLLLGPRRLVPLSLAAHLHGRSVTDELQRQLRAPNSGRLDGRFVLRTGVPAAQAEGLDAGQARLMTEIADTPRALDTVLTSSAQGSTLDRLVARGLVQICGFTPSDAAHVAGRQSNWDREAAELGAALMARRRDGRGKPVAPDGESFSHRVLDAVARRSAELVLESALAEDGFDAIPTIAGPLVQRALDGKAGIARLALSLDRPVVGLGASAGLHYARLDALLATPCIVPKDADVANALGAVVGQVRVSAIVSITQPSDGQYRLVTPDGTEDMANEDAAFARAAEIAARGAQDRAREAGADEARIEIVRDVRRAEVEGRPMLVEASVTAFASGRPRIAAIDQAR